jgi:hypothetical protein
MTQDVTAQHLSLYARPGGVLPNRETDGRRRKTHVRHLVADE